MSAEQAGSVGQGTVEGTGDGSGGPQAGASPVVQGPDGAAAGTDTGGVPDGAGAAVDESGSGAGAAPGLPSQDAPEASSEPSSEPPSELSSEPSSELSSEPSPGPVPAASATAEAPAVTPAAVTPAEVAVQARPGEGRPWGRVDADGTVYVRTADGERAVGAYPGAGEQEALAYFGRKFDDLAAQVSLLEQRIAAGQVSGQEAAAGVKRLTEAVTGANAVGDLAALTRRLAALEPVARAKRAEADRARQEARARALAARTALVDEAETLAAVDAAQIPWKSSGDRLRELFDQWRGMQRETRLDKATEDELWKRFSHARTTFDRKRRQHFGALDDQRTQAKTQKESLVAEAEALSTSTDWGATAGAYRDLMTRWKAAGRASKKDDDALWARFRAAQDAFFAARTAANEEVDAQFRENLVLKEALLAEAEALLPVRDHTAARAALRDIQDRWEAAGKVPRADLGRVEARLRAVETAVRDAEQDRWKRTNPEARARAEDAVTQLEATLAALRSRLEKAQAAGNDRAAREAQQSIEAREQWLAQARQALADFGG